MEFERMSSIARLSRDIIITEKIDGCNAQVCITEDGQIFTGSRNRWVTTKDDHFGFAQWAADNKEGLMELGVGRHYGEWWGSGINRGYGLKERRFSLFNTNKWNGKNTPDCVDVVPIIYCGDFNSEEIERVLYKLEVKGSFVSPGFMKPEGIVILHKVSGTLFKKTIEGDDKGKSYGA